MYDIIGDIHGHATLLKMLLKQLGYQKLNGAYAHPERKAVFVGDFTNRGPEIRQTVQIIRQMVESDSAYAVLGNHEISNILYHLKNEFDQPVLREKGKRFFSVTQTINEYKPFRQEWKETRKWMRGLPLFLELDGIRVVHAFWSDTNIDILRSELPAGNLPKQVFRNLVLDSYSPLSQAILQSTRGVHLIMPPDLKIYDHRKRNHRFFRVKWWEDPAGKSFHDLSFESKFHLPDYRIPPEIYPVYDVYPEDAPPVFFGHYCRGRGPHVIRGNICCVDACVTTRKTLAAYRWNGEKSLTPDNMVFVRAE
ncbi:MAG: metallophosphoesterase [Bacteroidota bacterium]